MTVNVSKPAINLREKLAELDKPTGIAGEAMLRADTVVDQAELLGYRQQNVIINGAMNVWQRGTSDDTAASDDYMCDRWSIALYGLDGNVDWDQETSSTPEGFGSALKISTDASETSLDSADFLILQQKIEGQNLQHFNKGSSKALPFTVSFWVRSSVASTYTLELSDNDNTRSCSQSYHINQADTWEYKTLVFPADATGAFGNDAGESFRTYFWIDGGSNYTSGTFSTNWQAKADTERVYDTTGWLESTNPTFYITGVQLVAGNYPEGLPFMHRSYGEELALCQRYYQVFTVADTYHYIGGLMGAITTTDLVQTFHLSPPMRAAPSLESTGFRWKRITGGLSNETLSSVSVNDATTTDVDLRWVLSNTTTVGNVGFLESNGNSSAKLEFKAEL